MIEREYFPRRKVRRRMNNGAANSGPCIRCGKSARWRSVADRCWRCEMEEVRSRRPFYVERDVIRALTGMSTDRIDAT